MHQPTFAKKLKNALLKPKQVLILDADSRKPAKNIQIRPLTLLLTPIILIVIGMALGYHYLPTQQRNSFVSENIQPQRKLEQAREQLAIAQAENDVKQGQIESFKASIKAQQADIARLNERVHVFESILQSRKVQGMHLLQASAQYLNEHEVSFDLIVVKGGSTPRYISGYIQLIAKDAHGNEIKALFENNKDKLPYRIETHTFLHGKIHWANDVSLSKKGLTLTAILHTHRGKILASKTCIFKE